MSRKRESELAITEVITETIGGAVHVALSSKELNTRQRNKLSRPVKRARYLTTPCKVDINLRINEFEKKSPVRSETWLFINGIPAVLRFMRDLQPVRVELGQPIELDCEVEAEPKPTEIVWFRNGSELIGERYRTTFDPPRIALGIGRSLVDDGGEYTVSVRNTDGEVTSSAPVVVLFEKPTFIVPLKDKEVHIHKEAQLICRLRALPLAKVTWLESGTRIQPVKERYRIKESDGGLEHTLTIHRVSVEDLRKLYTCHAINEVGEDQTSANLIPIVPPKPPEFVERFHDKSVEEGQPLALLGKVIGFPRPTIKWIRNDVELKPSAELTTAEDDDGRCQLGLPEVSKEMAGTYTCIAENEVGLAKCKARISVTDKMLPPIFIVNLSNQESIENDKVTFSCTVQGKPLPAITWYLNDEEVQGTNPRVKASLTGGRSDVLAHLTIDDVTLDDNGELKAVAKNPAGVAISVANLIVRMRTIKPKFLKGPDDLEITEEENGKFVASVDGKPPPKIEWFKGESLIKPSDIMIYASDDKTHSLTIKKARLDDRGRYTIKATNVAGEATASAQLKVNEKLWPPVFTEEMIDKELIEDDVITFRCAVNAKPPPVITWIKDGRELIDSVRLKQSRADIKKDEFGLSLTMADAEMTDSGVFEVVAKNSQGKASNSARLTVKMRTVKPALLKGPADLVIIENEDGYFQATITGKPEPTIQWLKDAQLIKPSEIAIYASEGQKHSLLVKKAQLTDGGIYSVKAINVAGELVANARLIVNEKLWAPIFTKKLIDVTLIEDDNINLECIVNAKPRPSITWYKDGKEVVESAGIRLGAANESKDEVKLNLVISGAELTDCGEFKVTARNSEGQATESARLTVKMRTVKPFFSNGPNDLVVTEHDDGYFRTTVDGKPEPTIQWFKGVQLIRPSEVMVYASEGKTHSLLIKKAQMNDDGPYTVKAVNEAGETVAKATLTVKEKLWAPVFTRKMADKTLIEEEEVSLHCTVTAKPMPSITWLKDGKDFSGVARLKRVENKGKDEVSLSLTVVDAEMGDSGEFSVIARNSEGEASDSARLIVRMRTIRPSILKGPTDLAINEDEEGYFVATVGGKPLPTIEWFKENVRIVPSENAIYASEGTTHALTIKDAQLHDAGRYSIKAVNEAGEIVASARLIVNEKLWAPIFLKDLKDEIIIEGDEICFQSVVNAKPLPSITWVKDGLDAKENHRILCKTEKIGDNEIKVSLTLRDAQMEDTGEVKVTARNSEGAAFRSARLTVNMRMLKPRLVKGPVDLVIIEDDDGYFTATVDGKPDPTVQWYKDDQLIKPSSTMIYATKDKIHSLTIKNAQLNAQGVYSVKATNQAGEITASARLTVNEKLWAPVFTQKMTDETLIEQDEIYFECTVNAKPLPSSIAWLKDGRELVTDHRIKSDSAKGKVNELNLSLFIGDAEMTDTGEYRVIAKNTEGEAAISARLFVNMRTLTPTLLRGPEDLAITEDEDAQFSAILEGKPEPAIQWLKDGVFIKPSGVIIYEKTNQTYALTIKNARLDDRGLYAIKATNSAGELIAGAKLTVNERLWAPIFTEKMANALAIEQDEISFRCTVSAKPLPSIVWMKDKKALPENPRIKRDAINGKDVVKLVLTISGAEMEDYGDFEVLAKNSEGEAINSAKLTVKMRTIKPTLLKGPADVMVTEDEEAIFVATLTGKPEPTVQWYKNNKLISPTEMIVQATKDHTHWLTIRNAQLIDGGIYTVKAVNEAGDLSANAKLTVIEKLWAPIFTKKMANGTIIEHEDISFRCTVSAKPLPSITWLKDGRELKESPRIKFDCRTIRDDEVSLSLYLTESEIADVGEFKVVARNSEGEASDSATLTVNMRTVKPILLKGPTDLTLTETEDGHFFAIVDGKPEPKVQWFKDNVLMSPSENLMLSVSDRTHTLAIRNAQLHDAGLITVKAVNVAGETSASAKLTVHEKLWPPVFTEKMTDETLVEGEEICLRWTVHAKPLPTITWLKDGRVLRESPRINRAQVKGKGNEMKLYLTISETELDDSGRFEVIARNSEGEASDSSRLIVKLRTRAPTILKGPEDLVVTEDEDGSFFVTVDGKPEPSVHWFVDDKLIKPSELVVYSIRDRTHSLTVRNAQLLNEGIYTVKAVNEAGEIAASATLTVREKLWPPIFTEKLVDKTVIEQDEVRFRCTVNAKPIPTITWIRDGKEYWNSPRISKDLVKGKENELKLSITVMEAEIPDSCEFKILAKNSEGEATTSARLDVKMRTLKPTLIKGPNDLVITEEEEAYFWATIAAKPDPTVQWFRNEKLLRPSELVVYSSQDQTHSLILKKARLDDAGLYTVKAANEAGELVAKATLTVKEKLWAPIIMEPMSDKTLTEYDELSLICAISAKPLPTITWLKNGRELKDGIELRSSRRTETEILVSARLRNTELADAGEYTVTAQNSEGRASDSASVSVRMRTIEPSLLKGPTDLVVIEHEEATFSATIDGKPEPNVHWLKDGTKIKPSALLICGNKDKTHWLTIKNARLDDWGQYSVKAVNDAGELTATAKLTVKEKLWPPIFTEQMEDKTLYEQEKISCACAVNAKPLPELTWFKDGKVIKDSHRIEIKSVRGKENELKLFLTVNEAGMSDTGEYSVTAKNTEGEALDSAAITIKMRTVKPTLLKGPTDLVVIENDDAVFTAAVFGKPEPNVQWLKNGRELKPSELFILAKRDQTYSLTIKNAHLDDAGQYSVRAVNDDGEATATAKLTVNVRTIKPTLLKGPTDLVVIENEDASFTATIDGKPEPKIQWLKLGREIKTSEQFILTKRDQTYLLTIKNAQLDDGGQYTVRAVNDAGELTATARLTVNMRTIKPTLLKGPTDLVVIENEDASFTATIDGKPEPKVQWLRLGREIKPSEHFILAKRDQTHWLTIKDAHLDDGGQYSVRAVNDAGELIATAKLTVNIRTIKPTLLKGPTNLVIIENEDASFTATIDGKPEPKVQWLKLGREIKPSEQFNLTKRDQTYLLTIKNAQLDDGGQYTVRAVNDAGELTAAANLTVNIRTIKPTLLKGPTDLVVIENEDASFTATIDGKPEPKVQWLKLGREIKPSEHFVLAKNDQTHWLTIKNAHFDDGGQYSVRAVNDAGELIATAKLTIKMRTIKPTLLKGPADLVVIENEDASFTATIDGKPEPRLQWFKNGVEIQPSGKSFLAKRGQVYWLTIKSAQLDDGGHYSVRAVNDAGEFTAAAKLTVMEKLWAPFFTKKLSDKALIELEQISFTCTINAKPIPSTILWIKNGKTLTDGSRIKIDSVKEEENEVKVSLKLNEAEMSDAGQYTVIARNSEGEATNSATLTVIVRTVKPNLLKGPSDLVITEHEDAIFSATINGKPEPRVQWLKNDREIKPSERFVLAKKDQTHWLTIKNAHLDDGGQYSVRSVNDAGELTATAKLTVNEKLWAPFFTKKMIDKSLNEQDTVFFECTVSAKPLPSITWFKEGMELRESSRIKIVSARGGENEMKLSFTLTDAVLSDSGQFVVRAKNSEGEASCSASLTVTVMTVMPIFLRGPSDLVVIEHEDASFSAAINGKPEPKVQWLKNGREIKPSEVYIMTKKDQTHSLTIKNTRLDDGGQYSVKAVNEGGELVSTAKLTVKEKLWAPVFTKKLIDRSFFEHDPVVLECAVSAKPPPSVIWTKDGKPLREDSRLKFDRVNEGNTDFKLSMTLTDGKLDDSGQYRVVVKNTEGEASNKGHLTVKIRTEKPWLLRGPTNLKIEEESSGSFVASVDGKPYPEIQWLKDSVPLTIGGRFITKSSGVEQTLIIKEAKRRDAGVYTIKATNEAGELKASATLEVLDMSPYFLDMLKDVMVSEGMSAVFVCKVYPDSAPVVWHTEETEVSPLDTRYKISTKGNERRLEIVRASRHDYGIITASVGELQSNATLTVEASETEIVETRLLWKIVEDEFMRAAAEFQCTRNRDTAIMRIESMSDPSVAVTDRVQSATQRRWVVKKAYISRDGEFRVDRWSVRSHVDYTITEEGLRDASLGRARYSKQTVDFLVLLMEPTAESRWLKDGESISPGNKYAMEVGDDGFLHMMVINDVQQSDEGIYTFMVLRQKIEAHITVEGSGPTQVYHSSTSSPGRLLSVKSRREVDTEALMSQLPSEIQKKKIGSKIVMTYDNRQQIETPTSETLQNQLHEFDAKVTGFEEEEVSDEEPEQEEVFGDEGDGAAKPGKERRSSLVLSRASLPQPLSQASRSGSLSSLSFAGGGRLGGRAKSEILYFAYTESGKDRPKLDF